MVGWYHGLSGHESEQALGNSEGQGIMVFHSPWGLKELYTTQQLNKKNRDLLLATFLRGNVKLYIGSLQKSTMLHFQCLCDG